MPEVIGVRPPGDRRYADPGGPQSQPQIVIFAAPAAKVFVVAVDALVIGASDTEVAPKQLWPRGIAQRRIEHGSQMAPAHLQSHGARDAALEAASTHVFFRHLFRGG